MILGCGLGAGAGASDAGVDKGLLRSEEMEVERSLRFTGTALAEDSIGKALKKGSSLAFEVALSFGDGTSGFIGSGA